jgi:hypothetical protein
VPRLRKVRLDALLLVEAGVIAADDDAHGASLPMRGAVRA